MYMDNRGKINHALKIIGLAGLAGVTLVAPNAARGLSLLLKTPQDKYDGYARLLTELKRRGLVQVVNDDGAYTYTLTPAGIQRLQQLLIDELAIPKPKKWDSKWRLIAFDVPSASSAKRAQFTQQLKDRGFYMLQKSLWVYPFPCFSQVEQIAAHYNVLRYCTFMEVDRIDELSLRRLLRYFQV